MRAKVVVGMLAMSIIVTGVAFAEEADVATRIADLEAKISKLEEQSNSSLRGYWKNGFIFEQPDKSFKLQVGGRVQFDAAFFDADEELEAAKGEFDDGVKVRRAYLYLRGTMYDNLSFITEYNFAGSTGFQSVYLGVSEVPVVGNVHVGHLLEPMGLEELSSNNSITFMERGSITAINPVYNVGIMSFDTALDQRLRWAAGVFKETDDLGASISNEGFAVTARLTGLPYISEDDKNYLHLGYSISHRDTQDTGYRVRVRPDSSIAPYVVDTKFMDADTVLLSAFEAAAMCKSLFLQAEWAMASVDLNPGEDGVSLDEAELQSYYVMASYFLTGEYRPYTKSSATIGRITPKQNATGKSWGSGAWEIGVRYNVIDLNDRSIQGGEMESKTLGLNWYLNPHTRVMWNYVMADVTDVGDVDIFEMRFQFDF